MESKEEKPQPDGAQVPKQWRRGARFWIIFFANALTALLTALEASIVSTALPDIVASLNGGDTYVWIVNGYLLSMASLQPMFGQLANVFGRRWPLILSTSGFLLGSGICGGANSVGMLIAGRVISGIGAAGINVIVELIVCDLVPLRVRGNYFAIMFGSIAIGTALGPFFGGLIVTYSTWRWVFYLALPIGGPALVLQALFLHVKYNKSASLASRLIALDWVGNAIFIGSTSAILVALSWAGAIHPWSSAQVLAPLIVGIAGLAGFLVLEGSALVTNPMMPLHLLSNRTSAGAFALTFLHGLVTMWVFYFLPVYFQGVLGAKPDRSGVMLLPNILVMIPGSVIAGVVMSKLGKYKPILAVGFALISIGFGLFTLLGPDSSDGMWVGFQIILALGAGVVIPTLLPAVQAPLKDSDNALTTSTWAFLRSFGMTWGVAIASAIFNNRADQLVRSGAITNVAVSQLLSGGDIYQYSNSIFIDTLDDITREEVGNLLNSSVRRTWYVGIAFGVIGFITVFCMKSVPLRNDLDTEYGLEDDKKNNVDTTTDA